MASQLPAAFGDLLKEYRLASGLTQEALAERAGVSARNIQNLERGDNRPLKDTARRLAAALDLEERAQARLLAAVLPAPRRRQSAGTDTTIAPTVDTLLTPLPETPRHNLPAALSSFIGREAEQARIASLLASARLVTLVGTGGVGKTRLALAVAEARIDVYPDGVWLVELAPLADPAQVPGAVARAMDLQEKPRRPILETLTDHLRTKDLLLVLDNCEHLVNASADLAATLLRACPGLRILATSREALDVTGERRYRVPSLTVPDPRHLPAIELAGSYEAVRLFVARAQERRDDFALSEHNARAVAEI